MSRRNANDAESNTGWVTEKQKGRLLPHQNHHERKVWKEVSAEERDRLTSMSNGTNDVGWKFVRTIREGVSEQECCERGDQVIKELAALDELVMEKAPHIALAVESMLESLMEKLVLKEYDDDVDEGTGNASFHNDRSSNRSCH